MSKSTVLLGWLLSTVLFGLSASGTAATVWERSLVVDKTRVTVQKLSCGAGSRGWIEIVGKIGPDVLFLLQQILDDGPQLASGSCKGWSYDQVKRKEQPEIVVTLTSEGGYAQDGVKLGRFLRSIGAVTYAKGACYSACAFAYLGGVKRDLGEGRLLFHMPYQMVGGKPQCIEDSRYVRAYYRDMLGDEAGDRLYQRTKLYCSVAEGWTIQDTDAATLYGLQKVEADERPSFDVDGALEHYNWCEIAVHLSQTRQFDFSGAQTAGYSCEEIGRYLLTPLWLQK